MRNDHDVEPSKAPASRESSPARRVIESEAHEGRVRIFTPVRVREDGAPVAPMRRRSLPIPQGTDIPIAPAKRGRTGGSQDIRVRSSGESLEDRSQQSVVGTIDVVRAPRREIKFGPEIQKPSVASVAGQSASESDLKQLSRAADESWVDLVIEDDDGESSSANNAASTDADASSASVAASASVKVTKVSELPEIDDDDEHFSLDDLPPKSHLSRKSQVQPGISDPSPVARVTEQMLPRVDTSASNERDMAPMRSGVTRSATSTMRWKTPPNEAVKDAETAFPASSQRADIPPPPEHGSGEFFLRTPRMPTAPPILSDDGEDLPQHTAELSVTELLDISLTADSETGAETTVEPDCSSAATAVFTASAKKPEAMRDDASNDPAQVVRKIMGGETPAEASARMSRDDLLATPEPIAPPRTRDKTNNRELRRTTAKSDAQATVPTRRWPVALVGVAVAALAFGLIGSERYGFGRGRSPAAANAKNGVSPTAVAGAGAKSSRTALSEHRDVSSEPASQEKPVRSGSDTSPDRAKSDEVEARAALAANSAQAKDTADKLDSGSEPRSETEPTSTHRTESAPERVQPVNDVDEGASAPSRTRSRRSSSDTPSADRARPSANARPIPSGLNAASTRALKQVPWKSGDRLPIGGIAASGLHLDRLEVGAAMPGIGCTKLSGPIVASQHERVNACFRVVHAEREEMVRVVWRRDGALQRRSVFEVQPEVHGQEVRAFVPITSADAGPWTVQVISVDGVMLAQASFQVTP